jgi:drug/metabolite transporter (DMT)-like permease
MNSTERKSDRVPPAVWLGLTIAVLLDTPMQLLWKLLAAHQAAAAGTLVTRAQFLIAEPALWVLLLTFLLQFVNWMWVLGNADLSYAQPFTALSYVTISAGAVFFFHEHLTLGRMVGIGLILAGVVLVGSTPHKTTGTA